MDSKVKPIEKSIIIWFIIEKFHSEMKNSFKKEKIGRKENRHKTKYILCIRKSELYSASQLPTLQELDYHHCFTNNFSLSILFYVGNSLLTIYACNFVETNLDGNVYGVRNGIRPLAWFNE